MYDPYKGTYYVLTCGRFRQVCNPCYLKYKIMESAGITWA